MDKEKETEEMARLLCEDGKGLHVCTDETCQKTIECAFRSKAQRLVGADYGNVNQAVKGFAESVKPIIDEMVELMFDADNGVCMVSNCRKLSSIPCHSQICIEQNKKIWKNKIDKLIKELYSDERLDG